MKTLFASACFFLVVASAVADDSPATEKGKLIRSRKPDDVSAVTWSPLFAKSVTCVYKGPSGQTWEETYKPPCHSYSTHEVKAADAPKAADATSNP
jgi:hypothetical protein